MRTAACKEKAAKIMASSGVPATAAKADHYVPHPFRPDIGFPVGVLHHVFKNGWVGKRVHPRPVYGMDKIKEEVMKSGSPPRSRE